MAVKFARLDYVKSLDDIPIRFNLVRQNMESGLNWYIDRYNPLKISECEIAGEAGMRVLLPVTEPQSLTDRERTKKIIERTIDSLRHNNVEIVLPPENIRIERKNKNGVSVADGIRCFPFFLCQAIKKWAAAARRDLRYCEAVVINEKYAVTESVLDYICHELNFLMVVDLTGDKNRISEKADAIFDETGLNVVVYGRNKAALKTADIIVNTSSCDFDNAYKRGAVLFDLSDDLERRKHLISRRPDLLVIDGLIINYKQTAVPLAMFEMALYLKNRNFRHIAQKGYDPETGNALFRSLKRMGVEIYSFTQLGKILRK